MASYTDFQPEPDDNVAVPPKGLPQSFSGVDLRACMRYVMAAVRNLGDSTPKLGDAESGSSILGSMAFQDTASVNITGGTIQDTLGGFVPVGSIVPFHGTVADAEQSLTLGYGVCDGRTIAAFQDVTGQTRGPFAMPDLRYYYLRFHGTADDRVIAPMAESGRFDERDIETQPSGAHDHGGATAGHALTADELPIAGATVNKSGNDSPISHVTPQAADAHSHGIDTADDHAHAVDVTNPFVALVPLKRLF